MSERVPTPKQRKLIKLWLYAPVLIAFVALTVALFVQTKVSKPFPLFFLGLVAFTVVAIARKVETSMDMVLPTREEVGGIAFFFIFFVLAKAGGRYFFHHDDWAADLMYYIAIGMLLAPVALFFRKLKPRVGEPSVSPLPAVPIEQ